MSTDREIRTKPKYALVTLPDINPPFLGSFEVFFFLLIILRQTSTFQWPRAKTSGSLRLECAVRTQLPDSLPSFIPRVSQSAQICTVPRAHRTDGDKPEQHTLSTHLAPISPLEETRRSILPCLWLLEVTERRKESPKVSNQFPWATDNLVSTQTSLMEYWSSIFSTLWIKAYLSPPPLPNHCSEEHSDLPFKTYTKVTFNSWFCQWNTLLLMYAHTRGTAWCEHATLG